MSRTALPLILLRIFLSTLFGFLLLMEILSLPGMFAYRAERSPELAHLSWSMLAIAELEALCAQVVIVCTWRLLTMVGRDRIFSEGSLRWVDGIVWSFVVGWVALLGLSTYLTGVIYFTPELRDPGIPVVLFGMVLIGAVLVLLVVVLRALLRQATALRSDMEAVI